MPQFCCFCALTSLVSCLHFAGNSLWLHFAVPLLPFTDIYFGLLVPYAPPPLLYRYLPVMYAIRRSRPSILPLMYLDFAVTVPPFRLYCSSISPLLFFHFAVTAPPYRRYCIPISSLLYPHFVPISSLLYLHFAGIAPPFRWYCASRAMYTLVFPL